MTNAQPCEGEFTILGPQNKCVKCGLPMKVHLQRVIQGLRSDKRVIRAAMIPEDEYLALSSIQTTDGITRVLVPLNTTDEEIDFINEELIESDKTLESIAKVTEFFEGSESPAEALASAETEDPGGLDELEADPVAETEAVEELSEIDQEVFRRAFMHKLSADLKEDDNAESNAD